MNNKKAFLISFVLILAIIFCSCQLAEVDGLEVENDDRLIGVFITNEHLDLFDFESYFQDNISTIMKNGGNVEIEHNDKYQGRIYAELKQVVYNPESGEPVESLEYVFEDLEGIPFFHFEVQNDYENYTAMSSGNYFSDAHLSIGDETSIEGTIYAMPNSTHHAYYLDPVYQGSDGQVYLTAGTGISFSGNTGEGAAYTQTLEEKHTTTENGEKKEEKFKVSVKIAVKYPSVNVNIIQMDTESNIVLSQDYKPNTVPDEIVLSKDTAYVIYESKIDSSVGEVIMRELLEPKDNYFTNYIPTDEGYYELQSVSLLWTD